MYEDNCFLRDVPAHLGIWTKTNCLSSQIIMIVASRSFLRKRSWQSSRVRRLRQLKIWIGEVGYGVARCVAYAMRSAARFACRKGLKLLQSWVKSMLSLLAGGYFRSKVCSGWVARFVRCVSGLSKTVGGLALLSRNLNPEKRACKRQMMLASVCGRFALCDPMLL